MENIIKLIEYADIAGFELKPNGENLKVENGSHLPHHLKEQLIIHKDDILKVLN